MTLKSVVFIYIAWFSFFVQAGCLPCKKKKKVVMPTMAEYAAIGRVAIEYEKIKPKIMRLKIDEQEVHIFFTTLSQALFHTFQGQTLFFLQTYASQSKKNRKRVAPNIKKIVTENKQLKKSEPFFSDVYKDCKIMKEILLGKKYSKQQLDKMVVVSALLEHYTKQYESLVNKGVYCPPLSADFSE